MIDNELKPCPFCGSNDVKDRGKKKGRYREAFIQCHRCNARTGVIEGLAEEPYQKLKKEAAALWNRRAEARDGSQA